MAHTNGTDSNKVHGIEKVFHFNCVSFPFRVRFLISSRPQRIERAAQSSVAINIKSLASARAPVYVYVYIAQHNQVVCGTSRQKFSTWKKKLYGLCVSDFQISIYSFCACLVLSADIKS